MSEHAHQGRRKRSFAGHVRKAARCGLMPERDDGDSPSDEASAETSGCTLCGTPRGFGGRGLSRETQRKTIYARKTKKSVSATNGTRRRICAGSRKSCGRRRRAGVPSAVHLEDSAAADFRETRKDQPHSVGRRHKKKGADDPRPVKIRVGLLGSPPDPVGDFDNTRSPLQTP